jgi:hypothetical protein
VTVVRVVARLAVLLGQGQDEFGPSLEVGVAEEEFTGPRLGGLAEPVGASGVLDQCPDGAAECRKIVGVVEEDAAFPGHDLVLDAADCGGNHRSRFPHRFGDGEPEALGETLLRHDGRVALDGVDDGGVQLSPRRVVFRNVTESRSGRPIEPRAPTWGSGYKSRRRWVATGSVSLHWARCLSSQRLVVDSSGGGPKSTVLPENSALLKSTSPRTCALWWSRRGSGTPAAP